MNRLLLFDLDGTLLRPDKTGLPRLKSNGYSPVFAAFAGQKRR